MQYHLTLPTSLRYLSSSPWHRRFRFVRGHDVCAQVCVPLPTWAMRAGARDTIYYNPAEVNVAIVTCGGLCPGLNDVVLGLVNKLTDYGVPEGHILGIRCVLALLSRRHLLRTQTNSDFIRIGVSAWCTFLARVTVAFGLATGQASHTVR